MMRSTSKTVFALALAALLSALPFVHAQNAAQQKTLAGLGVRWSANLGAGPQNGIQAVTVPLDKPAAVAYDAAGNFYIADQNNNLIRKVDTSGILTNYAGTGDQGFSGDGGQATQAVLDHPQGVAVDTAGNVYVSDTNNQRVRRINAAGVISTVAGTGARGFAGDGAAATTAVLSRPIAVAVDGNGNVFFADSDNNRVREVVASNGTMATVAGSGDQGFAGDGGPAVNALLDTPEGIAVDGAGTVYLSDTRNNRVRKVTNGTITTIAGNGTTGFSGGGVAATAAAFASPRGLSVAKDGTLYIADANNQRIRQLSAAGTISTAAGDGDQGANKTNGSATAVALDTPRAVAAGPLGSIAVADTGDGLVRSVSANGNIVTVAGLGNAAVTPLALSVPAQTLVYGLGSITATSSSSTPLSGSVSFYDYGAPIGSVPVANNGATLAVGGLLQAGPHSLSASFAGDSTHAAAVTGVTTITVTPATLSATVTLPTLAYGQVVPTLTGSLNGVLPQDANAVSLALSTAATITSSPGTYPVAGVLSGAAATNYTLAQPVGSLTITKANVMVVLAASSGSSLLNAPLTLSATVASSTSGTPTGTVSLLDGTTAIATNLPVSGGSVQIAVSTLAAGPHSLTAIYSGDTNFNTGTSAQQTAQVSDFAFALSAAGSGTATQTVVPGRAVNYSFTATPNGNAFPYSVALSATGLPDGATATFNPSTISLRSGAADFTLTVQTQTTTAMQHRLLHDVGKTAPLLALVLLPCAASIRRRSSYLRRSMLVWVALLTLGSAVGLSGCGSSTGFFGTNPHTYTVNVLATASNGLGSTLQRTTSVTLVVQ